MIPPIKVMLFDDSPQIRDSLEMLFTLQTGFEWLGAYADASEAADLMEIYSPDVVLMDIEMPGINGVKATHIIKENLPDQVIIMLTAYDDDERLFDAICAGASGYILKGKSCNHLVAAVKEAFDGGTPMTPSIAGKVLQLLRKKKTHHDMGSFNLTDREKEVLNHLVEGSPYKIVAVKMGISYNTVHSHIRNIYKKLRVSSVSEAVSMAWRHGL